MTAKRELTVPFEVRGQRGLINVRALPNDDPWASGHSAVLAARYPAWEFA